MDSANRICAGVIDTLKMARGTCGRASATRSTRSVASIGVDNSNRQFHGALLDAELLAEVYLAMTRGQESLVMELDAPLTEVAAFVVGDRPALRVLRAGAGGTGRTRAGAEGNRQGKPGQVPLARRG